MNQDRTVALFEVSALVALLLSYIWGWQHAFPGSFRVVLVLYFGLGIMSHLIRHESPHEIGIRLDNFPRALLNAAVLVVPAVAVVLLIGLALDSWHFHSWEHTLVELPFLFAWALAQQYGLLCVIYRRLMDIFGNSAAATAGASTAFALFHLPNPFLTAVTLAAGAAACTLYRREPNVLVTGLAHTLISFVLLCSLSPDITHGLRVGPGYFALR